MQMQILGSRILGSAVDTWDLSGRLVSQTRPTTWLDCDSCKPESTDMQAQCQGENVKKAAGGVSGAYTV